MLPLKAVFGQGERRHRAEQQHKEQRRDGDDQGILEIEKEIALFQHGLVADQGETVGIGRASGSRKMAFRFLKLLMMITNTGNSAISV